MDSVKRMYTNIEEYYAADEQRRRSGEADYGVQWRLKGWDYQWRVSYVHNTGEVYAVHKGSADGPVFVLAIVPPDPVDENDHRSNYYTTLDAILEGWPEHCGKSDSLNWIRDKLGDTDGTITHSQPELT